MKTPRVIQLLALGVAASCGPLPEEMDIPGATTTTAVPVPATAPVEESQAPLTEIMAGGEHRWSDYNKLDITYCVYSGFSENRDRVVTAMAAATADWSQDVQIAFRYLPDISTDCWTSTVPRLRIVTGVSYMCTDASGATTYTYTPRTSCPDGSTPQKKPNSGSMDPATQTGTLSIVYESVTASSSELLRVVKHELGHVLGFDHEDGSLGCSTNHQSGSVALTSPDSNSIMLTSSCPLPTPTALSALDRQGAGILYGHVAKNTTNFNGGAMAKGAWSSSVTWLALGADRTLTSSISGTGDLDLYVGIGFEPTLARYSAASMGTTASEKVTVTLPPYPFGQDIFVSVYAYSAGTLQSWSVSSGRLDNPMTLISRVVAENAAFDAALLTPSCAHASLSCDSGTNLGGRGSLSGKPEVHAPNHADTACNDGNSGTYGVDESVEALRIKSADSGPLRPVAKANVSVDVIAWSTTVDRLELYYRNEAGAPWRLMGTKMPTTTGRTTITFPIQLLYGGPVQTVRAVFRYNATSTGACPSDIGPYDDIDDLSFTVAPVFASSPFK
jgi:hypothetical protein